MSDIKLTSDNYDDYVVQVFQNNSYDKVITDLTKAIKIYPEYPWAYYYRSLTYEKIEQHDKADIDFLMFEKLSGEWKIEKHVRNGRNYEFRTTEWDLYLDKCKVGRVYKHDSQYCYEVLIPQKVSITGTSSSEKEAKESLLNTVSNS
jgi:tetratricopeptide (TPR) repeat protein